MTPVDGHWRGAGDLVVRPDLDFPFSVECKKAERWTLDSLASGDFVQFQKWWWQAVEQACRAHQKPMLIFHRNGAPIYAAVDYAMYVNIRPVRFRLIVEWENRPVVVMLLSEMIQRPIPSIVERSVEEE